MAHASSSGASQIDHLRRPLHLREEVRPIGHQAAPLLEQIPAPICGLGAAARLIQALNEERRKPLEKLAGRAVPTRAPSSSDRSPGSPSTAPRDMRPSRIAPILQPHVHGSCDDAHSDEAPKTDEPEKNVLVGREVGHRCDVCVVGCLRCPNCSIRASFRVSRPSGLMYPAARAAGQGWRALEPGLG